MTEEKKMPSWAEELLHNQKKMQDELEKKDKTITMLQDIVGKNRIADYNDAHRDNSQRTSTFKVNEGKIIIGWKKMDYSKFNPNASKPRDENAYTTVVYIDGTEEKINYSVFNNLPDQITGRILHRGAGECLVEFPSGEKVTIQDTFLNR